MRQYKVRQAHRQKISVSIAGPAGLCLLFCACTSQVARSAADDPDASTTDDDSPPVMDAQATPPRVDTMVGSPDVALPRDSGPQTTGNDADGSPVDGSQSVDARQAVPDVAPAFSAFHCPKADAVLCEDFESGALDLKKWSLSQTRATMTVDATRAVRGKYALHMKIGNLGLSGGGIKTVDKIPVAGNHFFIRAFIYMRRDLFQWNASVLQVMSSSGSGFVMNMVGGPTFRALWYQAGEARGDLRSKDKVPFDRWTCLEWEISGTDNTLQFWLDDKVVTGVAVDKTRKWLAPKDAHLHFTWNAFHAEPTLPDGFEVWMDEIAVSHQRIGCTL